MSYHYFRSHHGTPSSTRLRMITKISGEHRAFVTAVYWEIYDYASRNSPRGSLNGIDYEEIAFSQEVECHTVSRIVTAMCDKGFITEDNTLDVWDKEQPLREDDGAADRKRQQRQREKDAKEQKVREESEKKLKEKIENSHDMSRSVTHCPDIQQDKQTKQTTVVKDIIISSEDSCSELSTISDHDPPDGLWEDLNFNDIAVCFDVCCALLGRERLEELDARALENWHENFDMGWIIHQMREELAKRVKNGKTTNSLRFFYYLTKKAPPSPALAK